MEDEFIKQLYTRHLQEDRFPSTKEICAFTTGTLQVMFPALTEKVYATQALLKEDFDLIGKRLLGILSQIQEKSKETPQALVRLFMAEIPETYSKLRTDIHAIVRGDPAARNELEVIRAYPGFYAIAMYRIAHELYKLDIPIVPRIITEFAHSQTGIDIHPGARIAPHFCIDHGTGIVIGETSIIGQYVKIYQGVTLGALSVDKSMAQKKRHPTLEDYVVIYSGATILGGNTVIGNHSVIGGNVWLTKSVPAYSTVYHKAQIEVSKSDHRSDFLNI